MVSKVLTLLDYVEILPAYIRILFHTRKRNSKRKVVFFLVAYLFSTFKILEKFPSFSNLALNPVSQTKKVYTTVIRVTHKVFRMGVVYKSGIRNKIHRFSSFFYKNILLWLGLGFLNFLIFGPSFVFVLIPNFLSSWGWMFLILFLVSFWIWNRKSQIMIRYTKVHGTQNVQHGIMNSM